MKKFFSELEDLWVAAAFAEAGEYHRLSSTEIKSHYQNEVVRLSAL
jgi:hypothetical protein